jgi:hypothetical protein
MADISYVQLRQQYNGRYIAWGDGEVITSAETSDALRHHIDGMSVA